MPSARVSMRGSRLKLRFGVNGSQKAVKSLGRLIASLGRGAQTSDQVTDIQSTGVARNGQAPNECFRKSSLSARGEPVTHVLRERLRAASIFAMTNTSMAR